MTATDRRLWFGLVAALLLCAGIVAIGLATPDYSHVRQTVSELGEVGAPGRIAFTVLLLLVAACLLVFAAAAVRTLRALDLSALPAYFVGAMAISTAGVGIFPFPHVLHNVFGMSELVGYQAPLIAVLACRKAEAAKSVVLFSAVMYLVILLALAANLSMLDRSGELWLRIQPVYGIAQRSLFAAWFLWCAGFAMLLMRVHQGANDSSRPTPLRGTA